MALTENVQGPIQQIVWAWTTDASGDVTATTGGTYSGKLLTVVTVPSATAAPTADYDLTVTDANSVDVLHGGGIDRATATTEYIQEASLGVVANSTLTFTVANGGNAKKGTVIVNIGI